VRTILQYMAFISIFFLGFLALNYGIFYSMAFLLGFSHNTALYVLMVIAAVSYPAAALIERTVSNELTRVFYTAASAWMGISFYLLSFLVIHGLTSLFIKIPHETAGILIGVLTVTVSFYSILKSSDLKIKEVEVPLNNLKKDLKVVQLSDIHIGSIRNSGYMERIVNETNKLNPEMVFITGDMVDGSARLHKHTFKSINALKAPVFFVTGNHDFYEGMDEVLRVLEGINVRILRNELIEHGGLQIIGVEYSYGRKNLENALSKMNINPEKPSVLLYHLPREVEAANAAGINLQLSGHTHAGQMIPLNLIVKLMFPYMRGFYNYRDTKIYVSQGTGTWGPPMRLGSRCEITSIHLKPVK